MLREKPVPIQFAHISSTGLGLNLDLRVERPATNLVTLGTAVGQMNFNSDVTSLLKVDSHTVCRAHAVPRRV